MKTRVVNLRNEPCDVYIGRPSKWGNPFGRKWMTRDEKIALFKRYILSHPELLADLHELKGKRLGCHCSPAACHGDILAELADALDCISDV